MDDREIELRRIRIEKMSSQAPFNYTAASQCTNGEGVSVMILDRDKGLLTVGTSWLDLPIERAVGAEKPGWILYTSRIQHWSGGDGEGSLIDDDELAEIVDVTMRALAVVEQSIIVSR